METQELIKLIKKHMNWFINEQKQAKEEKIEYDLAYAEGAYNAYEFILNQLQKNQETNGTQENNNS